MPYLDLSQDDIGAMRSRLTLARIGCVMLWPDDDQQREKAIAASRARAVVDFSAMSTARWGSIPVDAPDLVTILQSVETATPLLEIQAAAVRAFSHGAIVGLILEKVLQQARVDRNGASVQTAIRDMATTLGRTTAAVRPSAKTIENTIWPRLKPVCHLWAAVVAMTAPGASFPCQLDEVAGFLAMAESRRREGESFIPNSQGTRTLLDPATTWKVPANIPLPEFGR